MDSNDINTLKKFQEEIDNTKVPDAFDPVQSMENSLLNFLEFRLNKLREDMEFQKKIKDTLMSRIPETDFNDLRILLDQEQRNTNNITQNILNPFIPRVQEVDKSKSKKAVEEQLFDESDKATLQSLGEMLQFFNEVKNKSNKKPDTESIKTALLKDETPTE